MAEELDRRRKQFTIAVPRIEIKGKTATQRVVYLFVVHISQDGQAWEVPVRYSTLFSLHQKLLARYKSSTRMHKLTFPSKSFSISLSESDLQRRRLRLEKYLQELFALPVVHLDPDIRILFLDRRPFRGSGNGQTPRVVSSMPSITPLETSEEEYGVSDSGLSSPPPPSSGVTRRRMHRRSMRYTSSEDEGGRGALSGENMSERTIAGEKSNRPYVYSPIPRAARECLSDTSSSPHEITPSSSGQSSNADLGLDEQRISMPEELSHETDAAVGGLEEEKDGGEEMLVEVGRRSLTVTRGGHKSSERRVRKRSTSAKKPAEAQETPGSSRRERATTVMARPVAGGDVRLPAG